MRSGKSGAAQLTRPVLGKRVKTNTITTMAAEPEQAWLQLCIGSGEPTDVCTSLCMDSLDDGRDYGWLHCRAKDLEHMHRMYAHILHFLRDVEVRNIHPKVLDDEDGLRVLSDPLEECPDPADNSEYYEQISRPTCLQTITHRIVHCEYASPVLFEQDMLQLFYNARIWYGLGTEGYAEMVTLLRLYNQLTPSQERLTNALGVRHTKSRMTDVEVVDMLRSSAISQQCFTSTEYGPGKEPPRDVTAQDVVVLEHAPFKGRVYHVGDWVHVMNPVDPARPIVGQIFRLYKQHKVPGVFFTACWYYRPEQTRHTESRCFYPNEVFQTGVYGEHSMEDILEDVLVLYLPVYLRARPSAHYWRKEAPLYVVEFKYDVEQYKFYKIEKWEYCVPSAVRSKVTPMDIFSHPAEPPPKKPSLLTYGEDIPSGMLLDETDAGLERDEWPNFFENAVPVSMPSFSPTSSVPPVVPPPVAVSQADKLRAYAMFHAAASEISRRVQPAAYAKLQRALEARPLATHTELAAVAIEVGGDVSPNSIIQLRDAAISAGILDAKPLAGLSTASVRNLPTAAAVYAAYKQGAEFEILSAEARSLFRQDEQGNVLWYAAPPMPGWSRTSALLDGTTRLPLPSEAYLTFARSQGTKY